MHTNMFPFLEFKEEETDVECHKCEYLVSSDECLSDTYRVGQEKIEVFLKPKENKSMMKHVLTEEDKEQIKKNSIEKYNLLSKKLNS